MSDEYKNFNEYETNEPDPNPPTGWAPGFEPKEEDTLNAEPIVSENTAAEPIILTTEPPADANPDPNPPTGWAPGVDENNSPAVRTSSPRGIISIFLSLAGFCTYGIASIVGIILSAGAYKRNKSDVTAKIGLTACILMTLLWVATLAYYILTPAGREQFAQLMEEFNRMMQEMSSSDIYYR